MPKCATCGKFLSAKGGAACRKCKSIYHFTCALLPDSAKISREWRCQSCSEKPLTIGSMTTPSKVSRVAVASPSSTITSYEDASDENGDDSSQIPQKTITPPSPFNVGRELRLLRTELQAMRDERKSELIEFRREMVDLHQGLATCAGRVDRVENRLLALENQATVGPAESKVSQLEGMIAQLKRDLNDREQELLSSDLEITNLPEDVGENVLHTVELVARKLGVALEPRDIVFAERVGSVQSSSKPSDSREAGTPGDASGAAAGRCRRIVVRLARRGLRDDLLRSARVRRTVTSAELGLAAPPRRFYLNERLTRTNKQLFYCARQTASQLGWKYMWTKRGTILAKQSDGKRTYNIRSEGDIARVFGHDAIGDTNIN